MSESDLERVEREGPLPEVDDDSELVGDDDNSDDNSADKSADDRRGVGEEHGADFVTLPSPGAGAYPVPTGSAAGADADTSPADQEAER
jgi:hypothetical protein